MQLERSPRAISSTAVLFFHSVNGACRTVGLLVVSLNGLQLLQSVMLKMDQLRTQCSVFLKDWFEGQGVLVSCCMVRAEHPPGCCRIQS